ncbi:NAD(P)H-binding protein [Nocardioides rubriscoriae]|uniref:NmrA family NAD(P)-binding protein n=1 Tax=Nocardioides rubriscoriae TaxID=642762 RepID=UPI0011DFF1B1|nr:NAD(P)H-binding protein [Nocardioides rubriscoriae]
MLVITGATGQLGSRVVGRVLARVPAEEVAVSVRDQAAARGLADRGVRVRVGDFTDPATLTHAFEGARRVLVVSASIRGPGAVAANVAAIEAARAAGAERVLYTSHQASSPTSAFAPQHTHAAVEAHLVGHGLPFTALRNGFYVSTLAHFLGDAVASGRLVLPEDGPVSWTHHDDLAEVAAAALVGDAGLEGLDGLTPPLTAPGPLDLAAVAEIAAEVLGRPVEREVVGDDAWKHAAVAGGMPPAAADFTLGMFRAARAGELVADDPTLERVLGRPAVSARAAIAAMVGALG